MKLDKTFLIVNVEDYERVENYFNNSSKLLNIEVQVGPKLAFFMTNLIHFDEALYRGKKYLKDNDIDGSWIFEDQLVELNISETPIALGLIKDEHYEKVSRFAEKEILLSTKEEEILALCPNDDIKIEICDVNKSVLYFTNLPYEEARVLFRKHLEISNNPFKHIYETNENGKVLTKNYVSGRN